MVGGRCGCGACDDDDEAILVALVVAIFLFSIPPNDRDLRYDCHDKWD
jgi:hypothetical protein